MEWKNNIRALESEKTVLEQRLEESLSEQRRVNAGKDGKRRMHSNSDSDESTEADSGSSFGGSNRSVGATTFIRGGGSRRQPLSPVESTIQTIPGQVAMRLRQAARLNEELQSRMLEAQAEAKRAKNQLEQSTQKLATAKYHCKRN